MFKEDVENNMVVVEGVNHEDWIILKHFLLKEEEFWNCSVFLVENVNKNYIKGEFICSLEAASPLNILVGFMSWGFKESHLVINIDLFYSYFYKAIYDENGYGIILYQDHVGADVREVFGEIKLAYEDSLE